MKKSLFIILLMVFLLVGCSTGGEVEPVDSGQVEMPVEDDGLEVDEDDGDLDENNEEALEKPVEENVEEAVEDDEEALVSELVLNKNLRTSQDISGFSFYINGEQKDFSNFFVDKGRIYVNFKDFGNLLGYQVEEKEPEIDSDLLDVYIYKPSGSFVFINPLNITSSDGITYMNLENDLEDMATLKKDGSYYVQINHLANAFYMDTFFDEKGGRIELRNILGVEEYPLFFRKWVGDDYEEVPASFSIQRRKDQYMLKDEDRTLMEIMDEIYSGDYSYEDLMNSEEGLFGNNYFILDIERTRITGISAN